MDENPFPCFTGKVERRKTMTYCMIHLAKTQQQPGGKNTVWSRFFMLSANEKNATEPRLT
jgi:hypothetical protein